MYFALTATTRPRREGERDGVDYRFVSRDAFESMRKAGELLEWAEVYGNLYGVPKRQIKQALEAGQDVAVKVDVQGAATIKRVAPQALLIFVAAPSMDILEERLRNRKTESIGELERRIETARGEMQQRDMFDYVVVNDEVERAVSDIVSIVDKESRRAEPRSVALD